MPSILDIKAAFGEDGIKEEDGLTMDWDAIHASSTQSLSHLSIGSHVFSTKIYNHIDIMP